MKQLPWFQKCAGFQHEEGGYDRVTHSAVSLNTGDSLTLVEVQEKTAQQNSALS